MSEETAQKLYGRTEVSEGGCWVWLGGTARGYGHVRRGEKMVRAHRLSWELTNGPIPPGLLVLHRCDVKRCINPAHLFLGTDADNMADKVAKGRSANQRGERSGLAKLTPEAVLAIMARLDAGETTTNVARDFGVHRNTVLAVKTGERWAHVTGVTR